ncbi:MAG: hypothetical protein AAGH67_07485 [Cyanobacteria bacterium P01_H01_bin.162]
MTISKVSALSSSNQDALRSLIRSIERSQGTFSLILARCNYRMLRERVRTALTQQLQVPFQEVNLTPQSSTLYTVICHTVGNEPPTAILVNGLETVADLDTFLRVANQSREEFRNNLACPLVIWVTDSLLNRLIRDATDFESWASVTLEFETDLSELTQFVEQTADTIFEQLLNSRENTFLDNQALDLDQTSPLRTELQMACEEIHQYLEPLPSAVEASSQFILGRVADNNTATARQHYERSLELWQQVGHQDRYGHVQFYLGLWWGNYAVRHLQDRPTGLQKSRAWLEAAIQTFEAIEQHHRVAQFINYLGEVLHRQADWPALDELSHKAFTLHQRFCDYFRQARALGFMAAVAIAYQKWVQAEYHANLALSTWQKAADLIVAEGDCAALLNWERKFHRPWYLYFLGKAQRHSQNFAPATQNLEEARQTARPSYDPDLYTYILNELREVYFTQKDYLKAYETRQLRREIQSQFNLRPFVGPGRLQASQEVTNPSLPQPQSRDHIAPEIATSARYQDITALLQRIERKDFRLSVVYGPSGVGKSSVLQAGLLPALKQRTFEGRPVIAVLQQVYQNWVQELGHQLAQACQDIYPQGTPMPTFDSLEAILQQLRENEKQYFKTVLIFDQFEEFFFANANVDERYRFYDFAVNCLKILDVEIILSMKEDYLHYLLICNRLTDLEIIGNNILDKKILYYIGNFTQEETYNIVKNRTQHTRIKFDDDLIDQMVNDLADQFDQVRPIELQIVGAQLQTEEITTLARYQELAQNGCQPKEELVNRYLENVVEDCGAENQDLAEIILYLLTSKEGTRPVKTKSELMQEKLYEALSSHPQQIDLILGIFVRAGLVLLVPSAPVDSYQLVHDYLVNLIREKVETKHQEKITDLMKQVRGLDKIVRLLAVLLISIVSVGCVLYLLYRNNKLLYQVTQLERDSIENQSKFDGYQLNSLESAVRVADRFSERSVLEKRTTLPIHTLQSILDNISERRWVDTQQVQIFAADVHAEKQLVATAGLDQTVKVWDFVGEQQYSIDVSQQMSDATQIWDIRFTAAGDRIAVIDSAGQLMLWQLAADQAEPKVLRQAHTSENFLTRLVSSPDKSVFATAGADGMIRLWQADTLAPLADWQAHDVPISSLYFSGGQQLVSADYEGQIRVWSTETVATDQGRTSLREFSVSSPDDMPLSTFGLAVSPEGHFLAAASEDGFVRLWDLASGELLQQFLAHNGRWITAIDFVTDRRSDTTQAQTLQLVTADDQGAIRSWSVDAAQSVQLQELKGHQGWIWNLLHTSQAALSQTAAATDPLLISTGIDGRLRFWELKNIFEQNSGFLTSVMGHQDPEFGWGQAWSTSYSASRKLLATAGSDGTAKVWQLAEPSESQQSPQFRFQLQHETEPSSQCEALATNIDVFWVVFSPDESTIATAGADCTVRLWDSKTGEARSEVMQHEADAFVYSVAFSPDGNYIASADSRGRLFLWTAAGEPLGNFLPTEGGSENPEKQPVFAVKFSPDGDYIATASEDGNVKLWALEVGQDGNRQLPAQPIATLAGHRQGATSVDFSGDGLIATAGKDGTVRIWEMAAVLQPDPQPIQVLSAYSQRVTWVEFQQREDAPTEWLATASKDGSVIIWDRSLEGWGFQQPGNVFKRRYQFAGHQEGAFSATFIHDGQQIAVAQGDGDIKLWRLESTPQLIERACQWLNTASTTKLAERSSESSRSGQKRLAPDIAAVCRKYE